jgi:hypothetical protein
VLDQGAVVYHAAASELLADNDQGTLLLCVILRTDCQSISVSSFPGRRHAVLLVRGSGLSS